MDDSHKDDETRMDLDVDEEEHLRSIPDAYVDLLGLTREGAVIAHNMSVEACNDLAITSQQMILGMLVLKIVEQVRAAIRVLMLGYYSAVPVLLRSALDSISVLLLISRNERQFKIWLLLSCLDHEAMEVDRRLAGRLRKGFASDARKSYDALFSGDSDLTPVTGLIDEFNPHVHPDVFGLIDRAGGRTTSKEVIGDVRQALSISGGNPLKALELLQFVGKYGAPKAPVRSRDEVTITYGGGVANKGLLDHYSLTIHAATHHLFDIVDNLFGKDIPNSVRNEGSAWHELSNREFET